MLRINKHVGVCASRLPKQAKYSLGNTTHQRHEVLQQTGVAKCDLGVALHKLELVFWPTLLKACDEKLNVLTGVS